MLFFLTSLAAALRRTPRDEEDAAILGRITEGDEGALADLYNRYAQVLYACGMRVLRDPDDTEDLLQEVFLQVWNKADAFDAARGTVYTWLVTMTRNRAVDRVRSKDYREQTRQVDLAAVQLFAEHPSANPQASAILGEEGRIVASALRSLQGDQQQVLALAYYEGYSQSEISELLKLPLGTVKSRMRKALTELRSMLRERL